MDTTSLSLKLPRPLRVDNYRLCRYPHLSHQSEPRKRRGTPEIDQALQKKPDTFSIVSIWCGYQHMQSSTGQRFTRIFHQKSNAFIPNFLSNCLMVLALSAMSMYTLSQEDAFRPACPKNVFRILSLEAWSATTLLLNALSYSRPRLFATPPCKTDFGTLHDRVRKGLCQRNGTRCMSSFLSFSIPRDQFNIDWSFTVNGPQNGLKSMKEGT